MLESESRNMPFRRYGKPAARVGMLLSLALFAARVQGQDPYLEVPFPASLMTADPTTGAQIVDDKKLRQLAQIKSQVLLGSAGLAENSDNFKLWYEGYVLRSMSHLDQLVKLPEKRKELLDDLRRARTRESRDALMASITKFANGYVTATQNFHPATRFNALLLIGELNQDEISAQQRFPNPLAAALPILIDQYKKPGQTDAMKLAALVGMLRHAQLDWSRADANRIPAAQRQEMAQLMLQEVSSAEPPAGRSKEGHTWMQRRAFELLAALGAVGPNEAANTALTQSLQNPDADFSLRFTAAASLGRVNSKSQVKAIDPGQQALQLAALLVQGCQQELTRMEESQKKAQMGSGMGMGMGMAGGGYDEYGEAGGMMSGGMMPGGMMPGGMAGGMMPGGMMPGMAGTEASSMMPGYGGGDEYGSMDPTGGMAVPKDPELDRFRRRLKYELVCVESGLRGMARLAGTNKTQQDLIKKINTEVVKVKAATDPPPHTPTVAVLHKSLTDSLKDLEKMTAAVTPKPKAPTATAEPASDVPGDAPPDVPQPPAPTRKPAAKVGPKATPPAKGAAPKAGATKGNAAPKKK